MLNSIYQAYIYYRLRIPNLMRSFFQKGNTLINYFMILKWKWKSLSLVRLFATPWTKQVHGILQARTLKCRNPSLFLPTQESNPGLPHCRWIPYQLSHKGSPRILEWVVYPFSSRSSPPRNQTGVSCIAGFFTN